MPNGILDHPLQLLLERVGLKALAEVKQWVYNLECFIDNAKNSRFQSQMRGIKFFLAR